MELLSYDNNESLYHSDKVSESENKYAILGLNMLFLLVENRLADFHCELELLNKEQQQHAAIQFCSRLQQHLMMGSYDQVRPGFNFILL